MFRSINLRCVILIELASEYCNVTHIVRTLIFFFFLILDYRKITRIFIPKFARPSRTNTSSYFHFLHYWYQRIHFRAMLHIFKCVLLKSPFYLLKGSLKMTYYHYHYYHINLTKCNPSTYLFHIKFLSILVDIDIRIHWYDLHIDLRSDKGYLHIHQYLKNAWKLLKNDDFNFVKQNKNNIKIKNVSTTLDKTRTDMTVVFEF